MTERVRIMLVIGLIAGNGLLMTHYAAHEDSHRTYPSFDELTDGPGEHAGEYGHSWMRVKRVTARGFVVGAENGRHVVAPEVESIDAGDTVQVFGVLRADGSIEAERVIVSPQPNRRYMYAVSAVGAALAIAAFFREWMIDLRGLAIRPRESEEADD